MKKLVIIVMLSVVVSGLIGATAALAGAPVHKASGGGTNDAIGFFGPGVWTYGFNAQIDASGAVKGQIEVKREDTDLARVVDAHIKVDCLRVVGNTAWIGGVITRSDFDPDSVGQQLVFRVKDNGEGAAAPPDEVSEMFIGFSGVCNLRPGLPLRPWPHGNVQVN